MHISATLSDKTELGIDLGNDSSIDDVMAILNWIAPAAKPATMIDIQVPVTDAELEQLRNELFNMTGLRDHWKARAENAERHLLQGAPEPLPSFRGKSAPMAQPAAPEPCQEPAKGLVSDVKPMMAEGDEPEDMIVHSTVFTGRSLAWKEGFRACRDYRLACDVADRGNDVYPSIPANPYHGQGRKAWNQGYEEVGRYNIDQIPDPDA